MTGATADGVGTAVTVAWGIAYVVAAVALVLINLLATRSLKLSITGQDGRASTSKFQLALWTYALAFALFAFLGGWIIDQVVTTWYASKPWAADIHLALGSGLTNLLKELDPVYLVLLGLPVTGAVSARLITQTKVANGDVAKVEKKQSAAPNTTTLQELAGDDRGKTDLGDLQYLIFNLLALLYFLVLFLPHPAGGLPDMPDTLVGLTGVAAAGYVAKKGIYREPPMLFSVLPPSATPGEQVRVYGSAFVAPAPGQPESPVLSQVMFGAAAADHVDAAEFATRGYITATVPRRLAPGAVNLRVIRPPGAESDQLPFEVLEAKPTIVSAKPATAPVDQQRELMIDGTGFLFGDAGPTPSNAVTIDGASPGVDVTWTSGTATLVLAAGALSKGTHEVVVYDSFGRPSGPVQITAEG